MTRHPRPRERDRLGRPLPRDADPALVVAPVPDRSWVGGFDALAEADAYLSDGLPFHAHEVLEQRWRCAPDDERPLWRALAQWAAALTHAARGNASGARAVAARAAEGMRAYGGPAIAGVDAGGVGWALDVGAVAASCALLAGRDGPTMDAGAAGDADRGEDPGPSGRTRPVRLLRLVPAPPS